MLESATKSIIQYIDDNRSYQAGEKIDHKTFSRSINDIVSGFPANFFKDAEDDGFIVPKGLFILTIKTECIPSIGSTLEIVELNNNFVFTNKAKPYYNCNNKGVVLGYNGSEINSFIQSLEFWGDGVSKQYFSITPTFKKNGTSVNGPYSMKKIVVSINQIGVASSGK